MEPKPITESRSSRLRRVLRDRTFRSLRHRNYKLYFFGQLVSFTGSWIQTTAIMWLAYDLTGDPGWPAYLLVAQVGPTLLLGPLAGSIADRFPKRRIILATQVAFMLNAFALAVLVASGLLAPAFLLTMQLVGGIIQGIDLPARLAVVAELVPKDDVVNAVGLNSLLFNSARAVGPAVAGLFFVLANGLVELRPVLPASQLGALGCFSVNAISYVAVLWALSRIDLPPRTETSADRGSFWDGLRHLFSRKDLAALVLLTGCFCTFAWPILTLFPPYTKLVLERAEGSYSLLLSAFGSGALVGALTTATYGSTARRGQFLLLGASGGWLGLLLLYFANVLPLAMLACLVLGFGMVLYLSTGQSTMQTSVPQRVRGRAMAIWAMTLSASSLPGNLTAGLLARQYSVLDVLLLMLGGVAVTMIGLLALVVVKKP